MITKRIKLTTLLFAIAMASIIGGKTYAVEVSANIQEYFETATLLEFGYPSGTAKQITEFTAWLNKNWPSALADIKTIAPDKRRQGVLVAGAEYLSGTDYVSFLSSLLDQYKAGKVDASIVKYALSAGGQKVGFLAFNFQHPRVQALCNRGRSLFPEDTDFQSLMEETLRGEQRKQIAAWLSMENRSEPEIILCREAIPLLEELCYSRQITHIVPL